VLLDRKRVKFWQKWVFLGMAFVMVFFLCYSGFSSCGKPSTGQGNNVAEEQLQNLKKKLAANPNDLALLLELANTYQIRANGDQTGSVAQTKDSQQAANYYERWLAKQAAKKGASARQARADVLLSLTIVYGTLNDWANTNATYDRLTQLDPKNPDYYLRWGQAALAANKESLATMVFNRYLVLAPHGADAAAIRDWISKNGGQ
jgi:tetratricopeptide (TPR) repeat protein